MNQKKTKKQKQKQKRISCKMLPSWEKINLIFQKPPYCLTRENIFHKEKCLPPN